MNRLLRRLTHCAKFFACSYGSLSSAAAASATPSKLKRKGKPKAKLVQSPKDSLQPHPPWKTVTDVVEILKQNVVHECDDFVVLNKPARLACFGYSPERSPSTGDSQLDLSLSLSIDQCFPQLHSIFSCKDEMRISLFLEPQYSGLIVLSKTAAHRRLSESYYSFTAAHRDASNSIYQHFLCLCWGPLCNTHQDAKTLYFSLMDLDTGMPFSQLSVDPTNDRRHTFISYKVDNITHAQRLKGRILGKRLGHQCLQSANEEHHSLYHLIDVGCNSTYCSVLELHLLHQGVRIVGEHLHGSRLSVLRNETSSSKSLLPILTPPETATLYSELPGNLRQRLNIPVEWMRHMPIMAHRYQIKIPVISKGTNGVIKSKEKISSTTITSNSLPQHFQYSMDRLKLKWEPSSG